MERCCFFISDVPELHHRFLKLSLMVPRAPLVFSLPNTIDTIRNKVLLGENTFHIGILEHNFTLPCGGHYFKELLTAPLAV